jgi:uncharacterized protein (DUF2267 family)
MSVTKRIVQTAGLAAGVVGIVAASAPETGIGRSARQLARRVARDVRYVASSMPGIVYRLSGRKPDPYVSDDILADRIRSSIGPLEKSLDVPHVHVMVEDHVAIVHGEVPDTTDARAIAHAIMAVSGVRGVESHLHAGLIAGDTRPSDGAHAASDALLTLLAAAQRSGAKNPRAAVHAVLCGFADRIPEDECEQMLAHLPSDVRALAGPPHRHGERSPRVKTLDQLVAAAMAEGGIEPRWAMEITRTILTTLRTLVPDEASDVAAVLPPELRTVWLSGSPSVTS